MKTIVQIAIAATLTLGTFTLSTIAQSATTDQGYRVDPCYKQCQPILANGSSRQQAGRDFSHCMAICQAPRAAPVAARCPSGLVWRERFDGDTVCVTPLERDENRRRRGL